MTLKSLSRFVIAALVAISFAARVASAAELTPVTVMTAEVPQGLHSPLYIALKKGWFKDEGLDVTIKDGRGSANVTNLVGAGQIDFGYISLAPMMQAAAKGVPVRATASLMRLNTAGLVMLKGRTPIRTQEDLRGKEILYNTATIEAQLISGWLALGGMKLNDVKMVGVDGSAKIPSVVAGKGDAAVGPVPYYVGLLQSKGGIDFLRFADAGQQILDYGVMTSVDMIKNKRATVAAFTKVVSRAFAYTADGRVEEAVDAMIVMRPETQIGRIDAINMFNANIPYIYSASTKSKPIGFISEDDVAGTIKTFVGMGLMDPKTKPSDLYVSDFMPK